MANLKKQFNVVLTGGNGFLGQHLLMHDAFKRALIIGRTKPAGQCNFKSISLDSEDMSKVLCNKDVVVHVAGRAHVMGESSKNAICEYRIVNTLGTLNIAKQAAKNGVKRFIFISTIKVLGDKTISGRPFNNSDEYDPCDPYSISKVEAEIGLKEIGNEYDMDIVILRPPLIYGRGVKGNFKSIINLLKLKIPLPFGSIKNKRSFVSVENLVDLIVTCIDHPNAKNKVFLVSDDQDVSTPKLFSMLSEAGKKKTFIFKCPIFVLFFCLKIIGKVGIYERLCGSMQVNIEYTKSQLNWTPRYRFKDSLANCWIDVD